MTDHHDRCASLLGQGCDCRDPFTWASTVPEGNDPSTDPAQPVNRQYISGGV